VEIEPSFIDLRIYIGQTKGLMVNFRSIITWLDDARCMKQLWKIVRPFIRYACSAKTRMLICQRLANK